MRRRRRVIMRRIMRRRRRVIMRRRRWRGGRRIEEEMQDSLAVEEGMMFNFPLVPLPIVSFPCSFCFKVLSAEKKLNNHIIEMHKDPTSCIVCLNTF